MVRTTCALICAYNEEKAIRNIAKSTQRYVNEVVVIDDGSTDETIGEALMGGARIMTHSYNKGKGAAMMTGFEYFLSSSYDNIVALDGDGQHLPKDIPLFEETLNKGYDAVIGHRDFKGDKIPISRKLGNKLDSKILSYILKTNLPDPQNGFRMFTKPTIEKFFNNSKKSGFSFEIEMLINMAVEEANIGWVPIATIYDAEIKSHIKPWQHIKNSINTYKYAKRKIKEKRKQK